MEKDMMNAIELPHDIDDNWLGLSQASDVDGFVWLSLAFGLLIIVLGVWYWRRRKLQTQKEVDYRIGILAEIEDMHSGMLEMESAEVYRRLETWRQTFLRHQGPEPFIDVEDFEKRCEQATFAAKTIPSELVTKDVESLMGYCRRSLDSQVIGRQS
jgi:hypothetical protein